MDIGLCCGTGAQYRCLEPVQRHSTPHLQPRLDVGACCRQAPVRVLQQRITPHRDLEGPGAALSRRQLPAATHLRTAVRKQLLTVCQLYAMLYVVF